jgi:hypothetical protein
MKNLIKTTILMAFMGLSHAHPALPVPAISQELFNHNTFNVLHLHTQQIETLQLQIESLQNQINTLNKCESKREIKLINPNVDVQSSKQTNYKNFGFYALTSIVILGVLGIVKFMYSNRNMATS